MSTMSYYQVLQVVSDPTSDLTEVAHVAEIELYCKVALASLLLYYTITTMDKELKYCWCHPPACVHLVYFLNRYIGLLSVLISIQLHLFGVPMGNARCATITWIHNIADWATVLLIDYILLIRVLALYNRNKTMSRTLTALLGLEASLRLACMIAAVHTEVSLQKLLPENTACVEQSKCSLASLETTYWMAPALFQIVLLILATYKAAEYWRFSAGFGGFTLVKVLIRDQVIYFLVAIACSVVNIIKCHIHGGPGWSGLLTVVGSTSFLCLLGSELLFNLKEAAELGVNEGTNYRPRSVSTIDFDEAGQPRETTTIGW